MILVGGDGHSVSTSSLSSIPSCIVVTILSRGCRLRIVMLINSRGRRGPHRRRTVIRVSRDVLSVLGRSVRVSSIWGGRTRVPFRTWLPIIGRSISILHLNGFIGVSSKSVVTGWLGVIVVKRVGRSVRPRSGRMLMMRSVMFPLRRSIIWVVFFVGLSPVGGRLSRSCLQ
jgi:hypothetical protein